jgi:hypothetical protein
VRCATLEYNARVTETEHTAALRKALAARSSAVVRVRLASGDCWVRAVALAGRRLEVTLAGARMQLPLRDLLEVGPR